MPDVWHHSYILVFANSSELLPLQVNQNFWQMSRAEGLLLVLEVTSLKLPSLGFLLIWRARVDTVCFFSTAYLCIQSFPYIQQDQNNYVGNCQGKGILTLSLFNICIIQESACAKFLPTCLFYLLQYLLILLSDQQYQKEKGDQQTFL